MFLRPSCRSRYPHRPAYKAFCHSVGAAPCGRPPAGGISPKRNRGFAAAAASFFLSDQKETKESPGVSFVRKALRLCLALSLTIPPDPLFYGSVEGVPRQSRPARKPHEGCLNFITAVLLNELDRLLLQGTVRLSCRTYTVGSGRRIGLLFVCRGRCLIGPRAATRGRPYEILYPFRGESLWGNI